MTELMLITMTVAILSGCFFVLMWRWMLAHFGDPSFWPKLSEISRRLVNADELPELLSDYKKLVVIVTKYNLANLVGITLGLLPVILVLWLLAPMANQSWAENAGAVEIYPNNVGVLLANGVVHSEHQKAGRTIVPIDTQSEGVLRLVGQDIPLGKLTKAYAVCVTNLDCLFYELMLFDALQVEALPTEGQDGVLIRPSRMDGNYLWPYMNDVQFTFFLVFMLSNLFTFLMVGRFSKKRKLG